MDGGRFQGLHKACSQAQGHHILVPEFLATPSDKAEEIRLRLRFTCNIIHENIEGFVITHELAAIDMAIAVAVLQRNLPLPASAVSGRTGIRRGWAAIVALAGQSDRTIARQEV